MAGQSAAARLAAPLLASALLAAGCGGGHGASGGPAPGFTRLASRAWTIPAGQSDLYRCTSVLLAQDTWVSAFHAEAPVGSHHVRLSVPAVAQPTGDFDCDSTLLDPRLLFESEGTGDFALPAGVALKLAAGTSVRLSVHLVDFTGRGAAGTTSVDVKVVPTPDAAHQAEVFFTGTNAVSIPPTSGAEATGTCPLPADGTLLALWPHMHQHAVHQLVTRTPAGGAPITLLDAPYDFLERAAYPLSPPVAVHAGDVLATTCTWVNAGNTTIQLGPGPSDEQCLTGYLRYPATGADPLACVVAGP